MNKFYGAVGFSCEPIETAPGIWSSDVIERNYYGDVLKYNRRWEANQDSSNDNLVLNNTISIIADAYIYQNLPNIRYVKWSGAYWKVTNVEVQRPRIVLTIGGVYNGKKAETP